MDRKLSTKAGMPTVSSETRLRWRGRNGNTAPENPTATANTVAHTVLVRSSAETRSLLAMTRRPSARTRGKWSQRPSSSTNCATALVAGVAVSMAMANV